MTRSRFIEKSLFAASLLVGAVMFAAQSGNAQPTTVPVPTTRAAGLPATRPAAGDFSGLYTISDFKASDAANRTGFFRLVRRGDLYVLGVQFSDKEKEQWQGVATPVGDVLVAAAGAPPTVSLADYRIAADGSLAGTSIPLFAPGGDARLRGSEKLTGHTPFGGNYPIAEGRTPRVGAAYRGTVDIAAAGEGSTLGGEYPLYNVAWNLADPDMGDVKLPGVGLKIGDRFLVSSAGPKRFGIYLIRPVAGGRLKVEYGMNGGAMGEFVLTPAAR